MSEQASEDERVALNGAVKVDQPGQKKFQGSLLAQKQ